MVQSSMCAASGTRFLVALGVDFSAKASCELSMPLSRADSPVPAFNTTDDNGDGVIDRKQVIDTIVDATGISTELWTNYKGGGIKLSQMQTVTHADWFAANDNFARVRWGARLNLV